MVEKVDIPVEETKESQEYIDKMTQKADDAQKVATESAPAKEEAPKEEAPILGKFKTQEDLVKSYQELEKKLGEVNPSKEETTPRNELKATEQSKVAFDFTSAQKEFEETGKLSDDTVSSLEKAGLPKSYIDNYIAGLDAVAQQFESKAFESTGGEDNYKKMTEWVSDNLTPSEVKQFNDNIGKDNDTALFTIKGMYARYSAETREPNLATGTTGQSQGAAYESVGQMKADMKDPRYATDSAFRKMVADKVAKSKVI